jgi:hypothetical protein
MTVQGIPQPLGWKELYHVALAESDVTKLSPLLEEAIHAVLDQIEDRITASNSDLGELNAALNRLRSRRTEVNRGRSRPVTGTGEPRAVA